MAIYPQSALPPPPPLPLPNAFSAEFSFRLWIDKFELCQLFAQPGVPMKT